MKIGRVVLSVLVASAAPALAQEQELVLGPEFEQRFDELCKVAPRVPRVGAVV